MIWGRIQDYQWHRWFAWRPVKLEDGQWAWLCSVEYELEGRGDEAHIVYRELPRNAEKGKE